MKVLARIFTRLRVEGDFFNGVTTKNPALLSMKYWLVNLELHDLSQKSLS